MRILWAILLVGLALVWTAEAWLGESQSELDLRYGKPDRVAEQSLENSIFYNDDWYIFYFRLLNDKAEVMMVGLKKGREVDRKIVNKFLKKNSIGNGFVQGKRRWKEDVVL